MDSVVTIQTNASPTVLKPALLNFIALLSSVPASMAFQMEWPFMGWVMYTMTIYTFMGSGPKEAVRRIVFVAIGAALINFFWILNGADRFTGKGFLFSIGVLILLILILTIYLGVLAFITTKFRWPMGHKGEALYNGLMMAGVWTLFDSFMIFNAKGFALILYVSYISVSNELYSIQPASLFGPLIITFVLILVNYLTAHFVYYRQWKRLWIPVAVFGLHQCFGYLIFEQNKEISNKTGPAFKAAIIAENVIPEFKWKEENANALVDRLFDLNRQVANTDARLSVWSETAVPWNYAADDEFLQEINKITAPAGITNLVGMNTDYSGRTFYNSIYCIDPTNKVRGRYDKRLALSLVEKPFLGAMLPFFSSKSFRVKEGTSNAALKTPFGEAGILLCNESTVPGPSYASVQAGAQFLVNPGNDGWFSHTYIAKQHFFHARLRAVETRKDIIINNNAGYSGLVKASGEIAMISKNKHPSVTTVDVQPNNYRSLAVQYPFFMTIFCAVLIGILFSFRTYRTARI